MEQGNIDSILKYVLKNKYTHFLGIFTLNEFKSLKIKKKRCALILFIDTISLKKGHWVCILKINKNLYFMDSYGLNPQLYHKKIENKYLNIKYYFLYRLQSNYSTICGLYTIFFIHLIITSNFNLKWFTNIVNNTFTKSKLNNDRKMVSYIKKIYPFFTKKHCIKYFCNPDFILNFKFCTTKICEKK